MMQAVLERGYKAGLPLTEKKPVPSGSKLRKCFERWLKPLEYRNAWYMLKTEGLKPYPDEAAELISAYSDHPKIQAAGLFLSACFNLSDEKVIIYRGCGDARVNHVGFMLNGNKTLVVPEGVCADSVGYNSKHSAIICNIKPEIDFQMPYKGIGALITNNGVSSFLYKEIYLERRIPKTIKKFLIELVKPFNSGDSRAEQDEAKKKLEYENIEREIGRMLKEAGYGV